MIKINNVSKKYKLSYSKNFLAVNDVSFEVEEGSITGIAGNSGCGKSTLARMIVGLIKPSTGTININNFKVDTLSRKEISRQVQMIFQHPESSFDPKMKLRDMIMEPMKIHNLYTVEERKERIEKIMKKLRLDECILDRYAHQISGGEAQRIAIARALSLEPKVLVLDEPTSMLDASVQASILTLLLDLQKELNLTYVIISHDLEVLSRVCHKIIVMNDGKVVELGDINEVLKNPKSPFTKRLIESFEFFY